jgi:phospholipid/cholesterol/gamma-HCH transport system ATP-binding protein
MDAKRPPAIEVKGLRMSFHGRQVLKGVDLSVPAETTVVILGRSGEGKSTLIKLIACLVHADSGEVRINGTPLACASPDTLSEQRWGMGMVFQSSALMHSMTVYDNLAFPLRERRRMFSNAGGDYSDKEIELAVREKLELVGLADAADLMPSELSGGMTRRAGIARAIVHKPAILLYDEPTAGLDPVTKRQIEHLILDMRTRLNVTSVIVNHDVEGAERLADRVVLLDGGVIAEDAPVEDFFTSANPVVRHFIGRGDDPR